MLTSCLNQTISYNFNFSENKTYIECLVRKKFVKLTPEEKVRQLFLSILLDIINTKIYIIRVEYRNLDISIYEKFEYSDFKPFMYPVMIIELKRNSSNVLDHKAQLLNYLSVNKCNIGILSTCKHIYKFTKEGSDDNTEVKIEDLSFFLNINKDLDHYHNFKKAKEGCLESFVTLISVFGTNNTMVFRCSDYNQPVQAIWLRAINGHVFFDISGIRGKKKQKRIPYGSFIGLLSIKQQS